MGTDTSRLEVHLDRPRGIALGLIVAAVIVAGAVFMSPFFALGSFVPAIILIRHLDPRPQLVLDEHGVTFGGFMKSTARHDVHVPWGDIKRVGSVETPNLEVRVTKSMTMVPPWMTRWQARVMPIDTLTVQAADGRTFQVYESGRGISLEDVRLELLSRMRNSK